MSEFRLLVFDWDGTLMDSEAKIVGCLGLTLRDLDMPAMPREALLNVIGLGLPEVARALLPGADAGMTRRFIDRYRYHFLSDHLAPSTLFPGALDTLKELDRRGYLLAVATGKGRAGLDRSIEDTACTRLFAATRCADETASKPDPRMVMEIMEATGVAPGETLMIGDTEYDLMMARSAGVSAVAVSYGVHERERLLAHRPLACLDDIRDIVGLLNDVDAGLRGHDI
jgi:phosphoglycolate phosphatase